MGIPRQAYLNELSQYFIKHGDKTLISSIKLIISLGTLILLLVELITNWESPSMMVFVLNC